MKFLRSSVKSVTLDFCLSDYRYSGGKFSFAVSLGKVVAKEPTDDGYLIGYQDLLDLLCRQDYGNFDGELLDESYNRALFCPFEEIESGKVRFFPPKTLNAFIYLEGETNFRHLCSFNPNDFDEISEVSSPTGSQKKRVIVFENITTVFSAQKPIFYLRGTETESPQGVERVWELWRDNERVECDKIVFIDSFYHISWGNDWEYCDRF